MNSKVKVVTTKDSDQAEGNRLVALASTAARAGNYMLASDLISRARACGGAIEVTALDLQARVFAQQGLLLRAEACWAEALEKDPGNPAYLRSEEHTSELQSHSFISYAVFCFKK